MNPLTVMKACIILLDGIYGPNFIVSWFDIPRKELDYRTPLECLIEGKIGEVLELAAQDSTNVKDTWVHHAKNEEQEVG